MINTYMEDIKEKEMEKFFISKERLQKDIMEHHYLENVMYNRFCDWLHTQKLESIGWNCSHALFEYNHKMNNIPLSIKQEMIKVAKTTLFSKRVSDAFFPSFFHKKNVRRKSDKIKSVLKGEQVKRYIWIEKEEEQKIMQCYYQIMISAVEEYWNIPNENRYKELYGAYFTLAESPYLSFKQMKNGLRKSNWSSIQNKEKQNEIKEIIFSWYKQKGNKLFPVLVKEKDDFKTANEYVYLLDEEKRKERKEVYQKRWEEAFLKLKNSAKKHKLKELEELKKEAEELDKW